MVFAQRSHQEFGQEIKARKQDVNEKMNKVLSNQIMIAGMIRYKRNVQITLYLLVKVQRIGAVL